MRRSFRCFRIAAVAGAVLLAAVGATAADDPAWPSSAAARTLAAASRVAAGDARRLVEESALTAAQRRGLWQRIEGVLAALPLMARQAGRPAPRDEVHRLRGLVGKRDARALRAGLDRLAAAYPFDVAGLLPPDGRTRALRMARALHEHYCAACHGGGPADTELPAWDLFVEADRQPLEEFAARLLHGVRGDSLTALENPLSDGDISALIAYYRGGGSVD